MRRIALISFVFLLSMLSGKANAAIVNYNADYGMGNNMTFTAGNSGLINSNWNSSTGMGASSLVNGEYRFDNINLGIIPSLTQVSFTLTTDQPLSTAPAYVYGSVSYRSFGGGPSAPFFGTITSEATSTSYYQTPASNTSLDSTNGMLVVSTAFLDNTHILITMKNLGITTAYAAMYLSTGMFENALGYYSATGVAPVPLPAALPLMGVGLLGLFAAKRRQKNAA